MDDINNPMRWERAIAQAGVALSVYHGLSVTLKTDMSSEIARCEQLLIDLLVHAPQPVYDEYMRRRELALKATRIRSRKRGSEQS